MTPEKRRLVSASGGKAAHLKGVAHKWNSDEAKLAGSKGGAASAKRARDKKIAEIRAITSGIEFRTIQKP